MDFDVYVQTVQFRGLVALLAVVMGVRLFRTWTGRPIYSSQFFLTLMAVLLLFVLIWGIYWSLRCGCQASLWPW